MPNARPCRDNAVEEQRGVLRDLVVLDEKFLELIDDQKRARHRFVPPARL